MAHKFNYFLFFIIAAIFATLFFSIFYLSDGIKNSAYVIFHPLLKLFNGIDVRISETARIIVSFGSLVRENISLKKENNDLLARQASLIELKVENKALRRILDVAPPPRMRFILADVVSHSSQNTGQAIVIDKGKKNGLNVGLVVVDDGGALVGKIYETADLFAKVLLINDTSSLVNVIVQNEARSRGILKGDHGLILTIEMLPLGDKIEVGQLIVTAGASENLSKAVLVGKVQRVIFRDNDIFQKVIVNPLVDFQRLEKVFIIAPETI